MFHSGVQSLLSRCFISSSVVLHKDRLFIIEIKCIEVLAMAFVCSLTQKIGHCYTCLVVVYIN